MDYIVRIDKISRIIKYSKPKLFPTVYDESGLLLRSGKMEVNNAGLYTLYFDDIGSNNYNVKADIQYNDGTIGVVEILYDTASSNSIDIRVAGAGVIRYEIIRHTE